MLQAVLFDIDNTLILFDEIKFFQVYLPKIATVFADIFPLESFNKRIITSTQYLLNNSGEMTNADLFMNFFCRGHENRKAEFWDRFIHFYDTEFDTFQTLVVQTPSVKELFNKLQNRSYKLVIASNPIWPASIQKKRLAWAGIENVSFELITSIENMCFCKPRLEYYHEICDKLHLSPGSCLMVGNDQDNDLVAANIGMKTFLTTDSNMNDISSLEMRRKIPNNSQNYIPEPDFKGPLKNVAKAINTLL